MLLVLLVVLHPRTGGSEAGGAGLAGKLSFLVFFGFAATRVSFFLWQASQKDETLLEPNFEDPRLVRKDRTALFPMATGRIEGCVSGVYLLDQSEWRVFKQKWQGRTNNQIE